MFLLLLSPSLSGDVTYHRRRKPSPSIPTPFTRTPRNQDTDRPSHSSAIRDKPPRSRLSKHADASGTLLSHPRRRHRLGTTRGPGRSPAVACIEPGYLFQRCRRSLPEVLSLARCRGADAVLLCTGDSGGYVRTCRWAELGVWLAGTGTGSGGY